VAPSFDWLATNAGFRVQDISPREAATRIRVPVLLVHGTRDTVTSFHHSQDIFNALGDKKRFLKIDGAGHNDVLDRPVVWDAIDNWLLSVQPSSRMNGR
jgi:pimeloyl-ACP methyl ester carboxylesterase